MAEVMTHSTAGTEDHHEMDLAAGDAVLHDLRYSLQIIMSAARLFDSPSVGDNPMLVRAILENALVMQERLAALSAGLPQSGEQSYGGREPG
jgi:hypothetical protein